jgi:hypothetical protein
MNVKGLLRRGSLQGGTGPSIATELGLLLPELRPRGNRERDRDREARVVFFERSTVRVT